LENAANFLEVLNVAFLGSNCYFVEPADGGGFKASISRVVVEVDDLNLNLNGIIRHAVPSVFFFRVVRPYFFSMSPAL
jgi:hypothetical protein